MLDWRPLSLVDQSSCLHSAMPAAAVEDSTVVFPWFKFYSLEKEINDTHSFSGIEHRETAITESLARRSLEMR